MDIRSDRVADEDQSNENSDHNGQEENRGHEQNVNNRQSNNTTQTEITEDQNEEEVLNYNNSEGSATSLKRKFCSTNCLSQLNQNNDHQEHQEIVGHEQDIVELQLNKEGIYNVTPTGMAPHQDCEKDLGFNYNESPTSSRKRKRCSKSCLFSSNENDRHNELVENESQEQDEIGSQTNNKTIDKETQTKMPQGENQEQFRIQKCPTSSDINSIYALSQSNQNANHHELEENEGHEQDVPSSQTYDTTIDNATQTQMPQDENQKENQNKTRMPTNTHSSSLKRSIGSISCASTSSGVSSAIALSQESLSINDENIEPCTKKSHLGNENNALEEQEHTPSISPFTGFFNCIICHDVPHANIYQCRNGHLMCSTCSTHFLADHTMNNVTPRCPCCRVSISRGSLFRNIAVENALVAFPEKCPLCNEQFERNTFEHHRNQECIERLCICKYMCVGCKWEGPFKYLDEHEKNCLQSKKTIAEIMTELNGFLIQLDEQHKPYKNLMDLINISRCFCLDLESRLYYSDRNIHMAYYVTRTFNAFGHQWAIKIRVNYQQQQQQQQQQQHQEQQQTAENPATTFKLQLKTRPLDTIRINFFILNGPFSNTKFKLQVNTFDFNFRKLDSDYYLFPVIDSQEKYRMLASRKINYRIFMFIKGAQ